MEEPGRGGGDAASTPLRAATRSGGRWGLVSSLAQQFASIGATVVLARLLTPADFGVAALAQSVVFFLYNVAEAGFGASLVVRDELDHRIASSMFWVAAAVGTVAAVVGVVAAQWVAPLLGNGDAAPHLAVACALLPLGMAQSVARGALARELRFRAIAVAEIVGVVAYVAVEIALAVLTDLGPWVVVTGWIVMSATTLVTMLVVGRWLPSLAFDAAAVRADLAFNAGYLGAGVASYGSKNVDNWSVSRWGGANALGAYYVAYVLPNVLRQRMTWVGGQVALPVLRRLPTPESRGAAFVDVVEIVAFAAFPALVGLAVVAEPVVGVFFGDQWSAAVVPLRILAVAAAIDVVGALTVPVMFATSRSALVMRTNVARLVVLAAGLAIAVASGTSLRGVALAVLVSTVVGSLVSVAAVAELTGLRARPLVSALTPPLVTTAVMAAVSLGWLRWVDDAAGWLQLVSTAAVGAATYAAVGFAAFRRPFAAATAEARRFVTGR